MRLLLRTRRGLRACWDVRGGRLPRGAVLGISVVACLAVVRSIHANHPVNIVDAAIALVTGGLLVHTFLAAVFASVNPVAGDERADDAASAP
jgi:hypothetical protein